MRSMEQMYKMALDPRIFPDQRLLAIMQGRDNALPMAIAMAAKQYRDQRRTAEQGKAAELGAKQPTVKDNMLAKDLDAMPDVDAMGNVTGYAGGGLTNLPAENMANMDEEHLAGGGIIAFADTGLVPNLEDMLSKDKEEDNKSALFKRLFGNFGSSLQSLSDKTAVVPTKNETPTPADLTALQKGGPQDPNYISPAMQAEINRQNAATPRQTGVGTPPPAAAPAPTAQNLGIGEPPKRVDRFAGLGETQEAFDKKIAEEKNAGIGDFLMNMGLKMMTTVGPIGKAAGEGGMAGLPSLGASRKTIRELQKGRQDYEFNMAKAQSALDEGDRDLAYKYKYLAEKTAHDMGMLAVEKTKAGAYAASVGSKADIREEKLNSAILKGATDIHKQNMENFKFASEFAKMDPATKQQYFAGLRQQAALLAGKQEAGGAPSGQGARAVPSVGAVVDGYKFKGGDPNNEKSWEKV